MWEVSSGRLAFSDKKHDLCFLTEVCDGLRPTVAKDMPQCYVDLMKRCWDNDPKKRPMASEIYEVIQSWKNNYEILLKFNNYETIFEELEAIHPQAVYTSRFISLKELEILNSRAVCTNGIINDDDKITESQENNKIIESQENSNIIESQDDNIPIEHLNKLMLEILKDKAASVSLSLCE
ncbi:hypothetical protein C2G38_2048756 [Gigaspora rosea]|uniref:Serine-threonine/tyrosine-protein kinase catalytic domain-containing protein n=1 Tax=Gigaspora rosea TaxID=44941 RepID=A0A397U1I1_9GLOM|nr:hypothetical protein C2G38_2048756 [Gigaspora rosea]